MENVTTPTLRNAVRNKRLIKKRMLVYKEAAKPTLSLPSPEKSHGQEYEQNANDQNHDMNPSLISTGLVNALLTSKYQTTAKKHQHSNSFSILLDKFVVGHVYPPDNMDQIRRTRRAGGQALYFPQVYCAFISDISTRLREAAQSSFGQLMATFEGGSNFTDWRILAGFPYLRPSRNRYSLYTWHDALKGILQLLRREYENGKALQNIHLNIRVYAESDYAWRLLQNKTPIIYWGSFNTLEDFRYEGEGLKHLA
mmetsp:Transcript_72/g.148  ORF Transcript_72/g.148 Transcript_72/m.148 type:complete len:254 (-) Transcript_72:304-1065(-)